MLFCHGSAEFVGRACDFPGRANVSSKDGEDGRDITKGNVSAPGETGANEHSGVRHAVWNLIVKFANLRSATRSECDHSIKHVRSQTQLGAKRGDEPIDPMISNRSRGQR